MALVCIAYLAAPQQHVVKIQGIKLIFPLHNACELVQAVVRLLTLNESCKNMHEIQSISTKFKTPTDLQVKCKVQTR